MEFDIELSDGLFTLSNLRKPQRMSITLRLAWRNIWRHPRRTWLTAGAMVFSNLLLIFLISIQLGSYRMMIENMLAPFTGHLQVQDEGYNDDQRIRQVVPDVRGLAHALRAGLGLQTVAARGAAFALAASEERTYGIQVAGVEPAFEPRVSTLPGLVAAGRFLEDPAAAEIVIGTVLARKPQGGGRGRAHAARQRARRFVCGDGRPRRGHFRQRHARHGPRIRADAAGVLSGHLRDGRRGPQHRDQRAGSVCGGRGCGTRRRRCCPPGEGLVVQHWDDLQPGLQQVIRADLAGAWVMYAVLVILVAFSVLNTQLMSVLERTPGVRHRAVAGADARAAGAARDARDRPPDPDCWDWASVCASGRS